jgi:hypothetical protein
MKKIVASVRNLTGEAIATFSTTLFPIDPQTNLCYEPFSRQKQAMARKLAKLGMAVFTPEKLRETMDLSILMAEKRRAARRDQPTA